MAKSRSKKGGGKRLHSVGQGNAPSSFAAVYELVRRIPPGRVATYGQISNLMGNLLSPLAVGWALHGCPDGVPWQRVVNAAGALSTERLPDIPPGLQRVMLESEGVAFGEDDTIDLQLFRWEP
jgi:methylated-DNA-protein-cysteine methyltransferase-like protein